MGAPRLHQEPVRVAPGALLELAARHPDRYPVLLDSAAEGALSQVSLLAALPRGSVWLDSRGQLHRTGDLPELPADGFLGALEAHWKAASGQGGERPPELPFAGGWFVYLGYELALETEPALRPWWPKASYEDARPVAVALRIPAAIQVEADGNARIVAEPGVTDAELAQIRADLAAAGEGSAAASDIAAPQIDLVEEEPSAYLERIRRAQEYIRAGDIYQANLSRPWRMRLAGAPDIGQLYRRLCAANPAPFAALAQWNGVAILSSSPERLVQVTGDDVQTRPIAGTRPRSRSPEDDARLMAELVAHPKERAEHIMLIDLERNDLGRICEAGTVRVDELMCIESYAHVHHIVSNVRGRLRADVTPLGAVRAVFPGGTITGCPKFRCMQIIAELEGEGRGAYTGSLGYLTRGGSLDLNILIRTMTVMEQRLELRAGAGIVADSIPERELEETRAKARGLLASLEPVSRAATAV